MNFDTGVADRPIGACRDAARTLQDQRGGRESISAAALTEFRGVFADCFRVTVASERAARSELVHMLEDVAHRVQKAKSAAEVERRRSDQVTEWAGSRTAQTEARPIESVQLCPSSRTSAPGRTLISTLSVAGCDGFWKTTIRTRPGFRHRVDVPRRRWQRRRRPGNGIERPSGACHGADDLIGCGAAGLLVHCLRG
ncbi:hypothetical protein J2Y68_001898 [Paenarthrobacter nitroguajacolicus]|nr:hypothetical protein [Paenarthrobacter nitroguajacolicus]